MKARTSIWSVLYLFLCTAALPAQSRDSLLETIGKRPEWTTASPAKQYDDTNIAELAGKSAAALKRYGLVGATVQDWTSEHRRVRLTLYEMVDPSSAYGVFTLERDIEREGFASVPIGTEGFRNGNRTYFWQAKYLIKLEGDSGAVNALGQIISESIFGRSRKPAVSEHLPPNNLVQGSERYVVEATGLDPDLNLDPSKLGFEDDVEVASAKYRVNGRNISLALLLYPTQQVAKKYEDAWDVASPADTAFRKRVGPLIAWIRGSRDPEIAKAVLDSVGYETKVTWNQSRPDISLREVILTIFTFIGVALFFTVVAGFSFGGFRIFMKARYPDRFFDRPEDMEIIQLKLDQPLTRKEIRP
jgi:hypothetical protein